MASIRGGGSLIQRRGLRGVHRAAQAQGDLGLDAAAAQRQVAQIGRAPAHAVRGQRRVGDGVQRAAAGLPGLRRLVAPPAEPVADGRCTA
jgi:hypothetical protein